MIKINFDCLRLLEAHGIRMLPEEEINLSQSLTLTEAGKLVLSSLSSPRTGLETFSSTRSDGLSSPRTVTLSSPRPNLEIKDNKITLSSLSAGRGSSSSPLNTLRNRNKFYKFLCSNFKQTFSQRLKKKFISEKKNNEKCFVYIKLSLPFSCSSTFENLREALF